MAKIKIQFNEEKLLLIKNIKVGKIKPKFRVDVVEKERKKNTDKIFIRLPEAPKDVIFGKENTYTSMPTDVKFLSYDYIKVGTGNDVAYFQINKNAIESKAQQDDYNEIKGYDDRYVAISRDENFNVLATIPFTCTMENNFGDNLYGIDTFDLYGGSFLYEDMAYILGVADKAIEDTLEDVDGPKYPQEITEKLQQLDAFICDNMLYIEEILHQFCTEGIKTDVTYWKYSNENIWHIETPKKK